MPRHRITDALRYGAQMAVLVVLFGRWPRWPACELRKHEGASSRRWLAGFIAQNDDSTIYMHMLPVTTCWRARSVRSAKRLTGFHSRVRRAGTNRLTNVLHHLADYRSLLARRDVLDETR